MVQGACLTRPTLSGIGLFPHCPPLSSLVAVTITASLLLFCCRDRTCKIRPARPICVFSPLVFLSPRAPTPQSTHKTPMCTHPGSFMYFFLFLTKHDVRGNFPGHGPMILVCETLNDPYLPCFCVRHASCGPMHPCAPIRAHLHLFLTVYTPCIHVYMYNLIEI